jgi:hypothetical protein
MLDPNLPISPIETKDLRAARLGKSSKKWRMNQEAGSSGSGYD